MVVVRGADLDPRQLPGRLSADPFAGIAAGATAAGAVPVSVRVVDIAPGTDRTPHRHPHSVEVVYVVAGSGTVWDDGLTTEVGPGDVVLVPAGTPHATIATGGPLRLVCFFPHPDLAANLEELDGVIRLE